MNERKLIGVSFCITYVVLTAACFALVRFGVVTNCYAQPPVPARLLGRAHRRRSTGKRKSLTPAPPS